jgi:integrase
LDPERRAAPIRISLGACPHKEARRQADLLIGYARQLFGRTGIQGVSDEPENDVTKDTSPSFEEQLEEQRLQGELVGELRAFQRIISTPPPPDSPATQKIHAAMRGFVGLSKELSDPENANPVVIENFEDLHDKYTADIETALEEKTRETGRTSNADRTASKARALSERFGLGQLSGVTRENSIDRQPKLPPDKPSAPEPLIEVPTQPTFERVLPASAQDKHVPTYNLDRRFIERAASSAPRFSIVAKENLNAWEKRRATKSGKSTDVASARARCELFVELIGDHPADTYVPSDLQAFIELLKFYPAKTSDRGTGRTAREIISENADLHLKPLSSTTIRTQYVSTVRRIISEGALGWEYKNPLENVSLRHPKGRKNNRKAKTSPLGAIQISAIFRKGVESGLLDNAMLPLLGYLTGRRIGLLTYTSADDIVEKFPGVWVIQPKMEIIEEETGVPEETPSKTEESEDYFVLHRLLEDIGFIQWAVQQEGFIFKELMRLEDPARSASSYMGRLLTAAGVKTTNSRNREVFHSLRGGNIEELRQRFKDRETRLQVGHKGRKDNHDLYGFQLIPERLGREIYNRELDREVDFSAFFDIDFKSLALNKRTRGRKSKSEILL